MKEAADALSFFSTEAGQWRFLALLFPGVIALAIYDLRVPGERRKWGDMGVASRTASSSTFSPRRI